MSLYQRGETWWVYVTVNGQRIRQSTGTTDKRKAQEIHDDIKHRAKQLKESGKTLNDALKLWLTATERNDRDKSAIRVFLKKYPSRPLSQVDGHELLDALSEYSAGNYNRTANTIRAAIKLASQRGWCKDIKIYRKKSEPSRLRFLNKDEWQRLEKELPPHLNALAKFSLSTGLRQANAFGLKWSSVDLKSRVFWVDSEDTKSKKSLGVPLNDSAYQIIKSQIGKNDDYVFTYKGKQIKKPKTAWTKALARAGIENFTWHDLRHTWASWHVQNGTPLAVLKELGGWSDINMVLRYAHLSPEHLRKYANNSVA